MNAIKARFLATLKNIEARKGNSEDFTVAWNIVSSDLYLDRKDIYHLECAWDEMFKTTGATRNVSLEE